MTEGDQLVVLEKGEPQRVSTPFQPNVGVSGIDLSGGGCQGLPLAIRYSHPSLKRM